MAPATGVLTARQLRKSFRGAAREAHEVLRDVSLAVQPGEMLGLAGTNGCGKTTLLRILAGAASADAGEVALQGRPLPLPARLLGTWVGFAPQEAALDPDMTGREILALLASLHGRTRDAGARIDALVGALGLADHIDRRVSACSGGLRRRLHVAASVVHSPPLVLADEPTAGLDGQSRHAVWRWLRAHADAGNAVIVASHDLPELGAHCQRVALMDAGTIADDDSPMRLVERHGSSTLMWCWLPGAMAAEDGAAAIETIATTIGTLEGVRRWQVGADRLTVTCAPNPALEARIQATVTAAAPEVTSFTRQAPDLASAYFNVTGHVIAAPAPAERRGGGRRR